MFLIILMLPLMTATEMSIAVMEEVGEIQVPTRNSRMAIENTEEMKKYMNEFHRQEPSPISTMNKYIKAYKINHEKQQLLEEIQSEKISKQNQEQNALNKIHKRSLPTPDLIKFELSDARTNYPIKTNENQQRKSKVLHATILQPAAHKIQTKSKKDMSTQESIMVKITHPVASQKQENRIRVMNNNQLPIGVKNLINMLALSNNNPKELNQKQTYNLHNDNDNLRYAAASPAPELAYNRYQYKTEDNHYWDLFSKNRQKRVFTRPQYIANYNTYPNYILPAHQPLLLDPKQLENQYKSQISHQHLLNKVITSKLPIIDDEFSSKYYYPEKFVQLQPIVNFVDQTQLFRPSAELTSQHPAAIIPIVEKEIGKESTAPILFPLDARLPKNDSTQNKTVIIATSIVHPSPKPDIAIESAAGVVVNPDLTKFLNDGGGLLSSAGYFPRDHTPITEFSDENKSTTIPGLNHDPNELQYASGYAFGYRVRDFHTGNDYGHTQNRDTDGVTRGEYHILLPDGRMQNVRYTADEKGFHANVSYEPKH